MWFSLIGLALAAPPEVTTDPDGAVRARMVVSAPFEQVMALVRDPKAIHAVSEDASTLRTTPDGACHRIDYTLDNPIARVTYVARGCPTERGFRTELLESDSFRSMTSEWTVRQVELGTELVYVYRAEVTAPVPAFIVRKGTLSAITRSMTRVAERLNRPTP